MVPYDYFAIIRLSYVTVSCTVGVMSMAAGNSLLIWNKKLRWNRTASEFKQKLSLCMFSEYDNYDRLIHCGL